MEKSKKLKIFIIVIAVLMTLATIALSIAFGITFTQKGKTDKNLNGIYEKSYFETINALDNISTKLSKASVLSGTALKQDLLLDVWSDCGLACANLSQLSKQSEHLPGTIKMINQIGDYSRYLAKKSKVSEFTEAEIGHLDTFIKATNQISASLSSVSDKLIVGDKIDSSFLSDLTALTENLDKINYSSIDYPELIYDGPFSDGLLDRESKYLATLPDISKERAEELLLIYFKNATEIKLIGESDGSLGAFLYSFKNGGISGDVSITKKGGKVSQYNAYQEITDPILTNEECVQYATQYIAAMQYENMKAVWISNNNSTVYVNFAYENKNIVYYPDLVKIKLSSKDGSLLGVEAQNYLYNHAERTDEYPKSLDKISINASLQIKSKTVCVIPTEWNKEIMCLEVVASKNNHIYYLYYDVTSGEAKKCLLVIDEDGELLI